MANAHSRVRLSYRYSCVFIWFRSITRNRPFHLTSVKNERHMVSVLMSGRQRPAAVCGRGRGRRRPGRGRAGVRRAARSCRPSSSSSAAGSGSGSPLISVASGLQAGQATGSSGFICLVRWPRGSWAWAWPFGQGRTGSGVTGSLACHVTWGEVGWGLAVGVSGH